MEARWDDAAPVLVSQRLRQYAQRVRADSAALRQRCSAAQACSRTVWDRALGVHDACQQAAAGRPAAAARPDGALDAFQVEGLLDGQPVAAGWAWGRLACDPVLRARAELLVDLGEVFFDHEGRPRYQASLDGPALAVALTLVRACDRVTGLALGLPKPQVNGRPDSLGATTPRRASSPPCTPGTRQVVAEDRPHPRTPGDP